MQPIRKPSDKILTFINDCFYVDEGQIYRKYTYFDKPIGYITTFNGKNYYVVKILNIRYMGHHVCWYLYYGEWPESELDHKDQNSLNNKKDNLEESSRLKQMSNRKDQSRAGVGVVEHWSKGRMGYIVRYKNQYVGWSRDIEKANAMYWTVRNADEYLQPVITET